MKVKLTQEFKKEITVAMMPTVREVIAYMKEDDGTVEGYAEIAINAAYDGRAFNIKIFEASAEIAGNRNVLNLYNDHSADLDIWIDVIAYVNCEEFIKLGAYLSDIWQIDNSNKKEIASHMYIRRFKEIA